MSNVWKILPRVQKRFECETRLDISVIGTLYYIRVRLQHVRVTRASSCSNMYILYYCIQCNV